MLPGQQQREQCRCSAPCVLLTSSGVLAHVRVSLSALITLVYIILKGHVQRLT